MSPKKGSTAQKKGGKAQRKPNLVEDPPVVVGGGSSVDVIFNDTGNPVSPPPGRKKFRLPNNITLVVINDGTNDPPQLVRVSGAFKVSFF